MKFATFQSDLSSDGVTDEAAVTIESNATAFYAQIAGLAENKIAYPVRELGSNAWDAAGGDVDIILPTELEPTFSVRDYGPGLSHTFMMNEYAKAYVSTKRDDPTKIGGWGLGRFSPFAYLLSDDQAGMYLITSWHGGEKRDYVMAIESDGVPRIKLLNTVASDERSGLMVSFQVMGKDIPGFATAAREIFWSFNPRPRISPAQEFDDRPPTNQGENWKTFPRDHALVRGPHVLLGCVMYAIDMNNPDLKIPSLITKNTNVLFQAQSGSLRPTLSREDLAYTNNTVETLSGLMQSYSDTVVGALQHQIDRVDSLAKAAKLVKDACETLSSDGATALRAAVNWRGHAIHPFLRSTQELRYMRLKAGWSAKDLKEFDGGADLPMESWVDHRIAVEHSTGHSVGKLVAAGLEGLPTLWVRSKARDRVRALNLIGMPEVVNLDAFKAEVKSKRPKTLRKRIFWRFDLRSTPKRETIEVDTAERQYYFRVDRTNAWHHRFQTTGDRYDSMGAVASLVNAALRHQAFGDGVESFMALPIARDQAEVPDTWVPFVPYVCERLMEKFNPNNLSPHYATMDGRQQPHELRYLHTHCRPLFQNGPPEIATLMYDLWNTMRRPRVQRDTPDDLIWRAMADVGFRPVERPRVTQDGPVHILDRWDLLTKRHPMIKKLVNDHYGWDENQFNRSIGPIEQEYERLLVIADRAKNREVA